MGSPIQPIFPQLTLSRRHIGPSPSDHLSMLREMKLSSLSDLLDEVLPKTIRRKKNLDLPDEGLTEQEFLARAKTIVRKNKIFKSYLGQGYYDTILPSVILRTILENPSWYTAYTPYQAEISQGRLEALLNFQTMVSDLTGLPVANSSLLDEATAAAEAMTMCRNINRKNSSQKFVVDSDIFPQTLEVLQTRAEPLGIEIKVVDLTTWNFADSSFGIY
ncbi:MAG: glycine dehydrogenase (aminomethyl-transferring), partial [Bdellovibrionales bacterium]|nr:glycine dehydrogenase (aminomethyl-transferring) [Bdellovibrionales bacterium]